MVETEKVEMLNDTMAGFDTGIIVSTKSIKQLNLTFDRTEYDKLISLCKSMNIKSVSGFVKECFYSGLGTVLDTKKRLNDMLSNKPLDPRY